jgi:hypothetical protein
MRKKLLKIKKIFLLLSLLMINLLTIKYQKALLLGQYHLKVFNNYQKRAKNYFKKNPVYPICIPC